MKVPATFKKNLVGRTVTDVGTEDGFLVIHLSDGYILMVMKDDEGNGPGYTELVNKDGEYVSSHGY